MIKEAVPHVEVTGISLVLVALAAILMLAALGATASDLQPSTHRVLVAAVIALVAPLFWPGRAETPRRTALTIAAWSGAIAVLAAAALLLRSASTRSIGSIVSVCAVLWLILVVTHIVAAALEGFIGADKSRGNGAREIAGPLAALLLAVVGSLPFWLGPAAELASGSGAALIDGIISVSPLTHLAVASGNDLLRNPWFYQHSNLAALRYSYPSLTTVAVAYVAIVLGFVFVPLAIRFGRRTSTGTQLTTERIQ